MGIKEEAKYQIKLKKEIERQENLERLNFNRCYEEEFKKLKKELGYKFWITFNIWDKVSKRALKSYLKDLDDIKYANVSNEVIEK